MRTKSALNAHQGSTTCPPGRTRCAPDAPWLEAHQRRHMLCTCAKEAPVARHMDSKCIADAHQMRPICTQMCTRGALDATKSLYRCAQDALRCATVEQQRRQGCAQVKAI